jgi:hypothetical protein
MRTLIPLVLAAMLGAAGCDDRSYREIGAAIDVLTNKSQGMPGPAIDRLKVIGRSAIPQIETAMHTAAPHSRLHLIAALEAIGDPESVHILRHFGTYDPDVSVREACEDVLRRWSERGNQRAALARAAWTAIEQKRRKGQAE